MAVTAAETPGLTLSNAGAFANPYGVPVLQVASEHQARLAELAAARARISFVAAASRNPSEAMNVVVNVTRATRGSPAAGRHDAAQRLVAVRVGARRGPGVLDGEHSGSGRRQSAAPGDLHRIERS